MLDEFQRVGARPTSEVSAGNHHIGHVDGVAGNHGTSFIIETHRTLVRRFPEDGFWTARRSSPGLLPHCRRSGRYRVVTEIEVRSAVADIAVELTGRNAREAEAVGNTLAQTSASSCSIFAKSNAGPSPLLMKQSTQPRDCSSTGMAETMMTGTRGF